MKKKPSFPIWKAPDDEKRMPTPLEWDGLIAAREAWASAQIVGWEKRGLQLEDKDFRSWISEVPSGAENAHLGLRLAALYEYARDVEKLRGLLLLLNPDRKRAAWEEYGRESAEHGGGSYLSGFAKARQMTYQGLTEELARNGLYGLVDALAFLAEPLAANLSFAEVWREKQKLVWRALKHGDLLYQLRTRHGITSHWKLGRGAPVELAWQEERKEATAFNTPRQINNGKEIITLRVDWANFRDEHLKDRFGEIIKYLRQTKEGGVSVPPEPKVQKQGRKSTSLTGDLSKLRAMRFLHHYPNVAQAVLEARRFGNKFVSDEHLYRDAKAGRTEFKKCFPFEAEPYHSRTAGRSCRV